MAKGYVHIKEVGLRNPSFKLQWLKMIQVVLIEVQNKPTPIMDLKYAFIDVHLNEEIFMDELLSFYVQF